MLSLKLNSTDWSIRAGKMSPGLGFETADDLPGLPAQYWPTDHTLLKSFRPNPAHQSAACEKIREPSISHMTWLRGSLLSWHCVIPPVP